MQAYKYQPQPVIIYARNRAAAQAYAIKKQLILIKPSHRRISQKRELEITLSLGKLAAWWAPDLLPKTKVLALNCRIVNLRPITHIILHRQVSMATPDLAT